VAPRERPPVLPDRSNDELTYATLYTENVYENVPELEKGDVKYIRVMQMIHWIERAGEQGVQWHPLANASEAFGFGGTGGPVRTVGLVPVEEDGSAYFQVPADADLYFQALDGNFRAVRRMRTHVEFQPGESRGCVGCHETKSIVPAPVRSDTMAMQKPAVRPAAPPWGDTTLLDYEEHIQPLFNEKCVKCHAGKADQKGPILTAVRDQHGFMQGFRALFGLKPNDPTPDVAWTVTGVVDRKKVKVPRDHEHPWWDVMYEDIYVRGKTGGRVTEINQFGAVKHPFATKLVEDGKHRERLTEQELQLLMNYFDVQAPYFSTFRRQERRDLIQVRLEPYPPFGKSREHTIHYGQDVTPKPAPGT
jgi:hypothetical protein